MVVVAAAAAAVVVAAPSVNGDNAEELATLAAPAVLLASSVLVYLRLTTRSARSRGSKC